MGRHYLADSTNRTYLSTSLALDTLLLIYYYQVIVKANGSLWAYAYTNPAASTPLDIYINHTLPLYGQKSYSFNLPESRPLADTAQSGLRVNYSRA